MAERPENPRPAPQVYSIAAHRGFADALVAGLVPRYAEPEFGLARLTLLLPSRRAVRTLSEAFIRFYGAQGGQSGLLMPRMAVVGDLDLDEALGALFDPIGADSQMPPAVDTTFRWLRLAQIIREEAGERYSGAAALRLAEQMAQAMDRLLVEQIGPEELLQDKVLGLVGEMTDHWRRGLRLFMVVQDRWLAELMARGEVDPADRRNRLFRAVAKKWKAEPPPYPIVAAGVTSASPLLARLLKVVSQLPKGAVVLPDFDLELDGEVWAELGVAGAPEDKGDPAFGARDAVTHPQYHLKLLLNRMGVNRGEVQPWHRAGLGKGPPERSHAISSLFLPPNASRAWAGLPPEKRRLAGVRVMTTANPEHEAQAIALLLREALEVPEKRAALITPDRGLAGRVVAHLARWNIEADDTAGRPLSHTAAGRVLLLLAEVTAEEAAPVPLIALLGHPLVGAGDGRAEWLEQVRTLELRLRGPRKGPGLAPVRAAASGRDAARSWWNGVEAILAPLLALAGQDEASLAEQIDALAAAGEALCGPPLWAQPDGRALSALVEELRRNAAEAKATLAPADLPTVLRERMDLVAVRPPWGGHPRLAIYGLLEARMSRADLVICGGLNEGTWPGVPAQDPLLAPAVLRALGVPGGDFRIGLAAHDLAGMLGAPEVVLSRASRDASGPAIPSRFLLRVEALLGELYTQANSPYREERIPALARALNPAPAEPPRYPRPAPRPSAEQRRVAVSVTALDRLRGDPYQFYASHILRLRALDRLDAEPSPAWRGEVAHRVLERWHAEGGDLHTIALEELQAMSAHPLMRALWQPRLLAALDWIGERVEAQAKEGRVVAAVEAQGEMQVDGVTVIGRADRIDRLADGSLTVVDYKTGAPPSPAMVEQGFALQLGLVGMMAQRGGIAGVSGDPAAFEYWSLGRGRDGNFGYVQSPVRTGAMRTGVPLDDYLPETERYLKDAIGRWLTGDEPFTARLNPDLAVYSDYDQLMRLDEWQARGAESGGEGGA